MGSQSRTRLSDWTEVSSYLLSSVFFLSSPQSLESTNCLSMGSAVSPVLDISYKGIMHCVALCIWLSSLSMFFRYMHVIVCMSKTFLFSVWKIFHCLDLLHFAYPFIFWCTFELFTPFSSCEVFCYEHSWVSHSFVSLLAFSIWGHILRSWSHRRVRHDWAWHANNMANDVEHLFNILKLLAIYTSSEKCLFKPFIHFLFGLFVFLLLSCQSSLYILNSRPLSEKWLANIFCYSVSCLSFPWWCPLMCKMLEFGSRPIYLLSLLLLVFLGHIYESIA